MTRVVAIVLAVCLALLVLAVVLVAALPRARAAGGASIARPRVLCVGDSLTAGFHDGGRGEHPYGATLGRLASLDTVTLGRSGWTARRMLQACSESGSPDSVTSAIDRDGPFALVMLMAGTNDLAYRVPPGEIAATVWRLHQLCHARGCRTLAVGIPGSRGQVGPAAAAAATANRLLRDECRASDRATYVDCPLAYGATRFWEPDGLHMSPAGYDELARLLRPTVLAALATR